MKHALEDYDNSEIAKLIDERIHSERDRSIMKRRLIDGKLFKELEDEFGITSRHCQRIVSNSLCKIFKRKP